MQLSAKLIFVFASAIAVPQAQAACTLIDRDINLDGSFGTRGSVPFTAMNTERTKFEAAIDINFSGFHAVAEVTPQGVKLVINGPNGTSVNSFITPASIIKQPTLDVLDGFKSRFSAEWEAEISCDYKN